LEVIKTKLYSGAVRCHSCSTTVHYISS
jgi:hypothetical protein